jgi:hypothetical protein
MRKIHIVDLERQLIERKRALGILGNDFLPRNDGSRRTESKRRLLRAIDRYARRQPFAAKRAVVPGSE